MPRGSRRGKACAGAERDAAVIGNTEDRDVVVGHFVNLGQAGEGAEPCVAGYFGRFDRAYGLVSHHDVISFQRDPRGIAM